MSRLQSIPYESFTLKNAECNAQREGYKESERTYQRTKFQFHEFESEALFQREAIYYRVASLFSPDFVSPRVNVASSGKHFASACEVIGNKVSLTEMLESYVKQKRDELNNKIPVLEKEKDQQILAVENCYKAFIDIYESLTELYRDEEVDLPHDFVALKNVDKNFDNLKEGFVRLRIILNADAICDKLIGAEGFVSQDFPSNDLPLGKKHKALEDKINLQIDKSRSGVAAVSALNDAMHNAVATLDVLTEEPDEASSYWSDFCLEFINNKLKANSLEQLAEKVAIQFFLHQPLSHVMCIETLNRTDFFIESFELQDIEKILENQTDDLFFHHEKVNNKKLLAFIKVLHQQNAFKQKIIFTLQNIAFTTDLSGVFGLSAEHPVAAYLTFFQERLISFLNRSSYFGYCMSSAYEAIEIDALRQNYAAYFVFLRREIADQKDANAIISEVKRNILLKMRRLYFNQLRRFLQSSIETYYEPSDLSESKEEDDQKRNELNQNSNDLLIAKFDAALVGLYQSMLKDYDENDWGEFVKRLQLLVKYYDLREVEESGRLKQLSQILKYIELMAGSIESVIGQLNDPVGRNKLTRPNLYWNIDDAAKNIGAHDFVKSVMLSIVFETDIKKGRFNLSKKLIMLMYNHKRSEFISERNDKSLENIIPNFDDLEKKVLAENSSLSPAEQVSAIIVSIRKITSAEFVEHFFQHFVEHFFCQMHIEKSDDKLSWLPQKNSTDALRLVRKFFNFKADKLMVREFLKTFDDILKHLPCRYVWSDESQYAYKQLAFDEPPSNGQKFNHLDDTLGSGEVSNASSPREAKTAVNAQSEAPVGRYSFWGGLCAVSSAVGSLAKSASDYMPGISKNK